MNPLRQQWYPEDEELATLHREIEILMQRLARLENAFAQAKFLEASK